MKHKNTEHTSTKHDTAQVKVQESRKNNFFLVKSSAKKNLTLATTHHFPSTTSLHPIPSKVSSPHLSRTEGRIIMYVPRRVGKSSSIIVFVVKSPKRLVAKEEERSRALQKSLFFRNNVPSCRSHSRQIKSFARKQDKKKQKQAQVNFIRHNKETHA
jgi:hypothetical protein